MTARWTQPGGDMTYVKHEMLKKELAGKEQAAVAKSTQKLQMYTQRVRASTVRPLDRSKVLTDAKVLDDAFPSGSRPSLPTNVNDVAPRDVNVNTLRYRRQENPTLGMPMDGGRTYCPSVLQDNWTEERRDAGYAPGTHPKELNTPWQYRSEYTDRFQPTSDRFRSRLEQTYGTAVFPKVPGKAAAAMAAGSQPPPDAFLKGTQESDGSHLYYSKSGFGEAPRQDHTLPVHRGAFWVGTAPVHGHESVTTTALRPEKLEFQQMQRLSTLWPMGYPFQQDLTLKPRTVLLGSKPLTSEDARTAEVRERLVARQARYTPTWGSMYARDFKDFSRKGLASAAAPATPVAATAGAAGAGSQQAGGSGRPITAPP